MLSKEFIFVISFTLVMGLCWFFVAGIIQNKRTTHTTEYLCNKRTERLRYFFPGCHYTSDGNVNGKSIMEQYSAGNRYVRSLGYMTFSGRYEEFKIDDAITEYDRGDSDLPDDYYESLLFQYHISTNSPVYQLGYMHVKRVGKTKAFVSKLVNSAKNKAFNIVDGPEVDRKKYFSVGKNGIEAFIPAGYNQDRWVNLLEQGLSERIEVLFQMYGKASDIEIAYDFDKLFLCVSIDIGHDIKFDEEKDFVISNVELISRTMVEMEGLCYFFD